MKIPRANKTAAGDAVLVPSRVMTLPDGRMMGYGDYGAPYGLPIVGFHGTPGSRLMFRIADVPARELGLRIIAPERPGFGISTYRQGTTLASHARDAVLLADRLGIRQFAVAGISGGGPYATACAAIAPDRVTALGLVSPVGPVNGSEGARYIGAGHHLVFRLSPRIPPLLWPFLSVGRAAILHTPVAIYAMLMRRATASDRTILARPDVRRSLLQGIAEGIRPGVGGILQELKLFSRPWQVPFDAIRAPSVLWQGTADPNVPPSAAFQLGRLIPGCEVHRLDGAGHYWIFDHIGLVLERLASAARRRHRGDCAAEAGGMRVETLH